MLKQLAIQNFQSHQATTVVFGRKLTCVCGPSNQGKTAILRALGWIINNRPRGSGFIRNGSDDACVTLTLDDGRTVTRRRDRKGRINEYQVGGETLTALGADVPEQVTNLLGLADINVSNQLAQHFLLLDPPGQIAKTINEAVHLERAEAVVDRASAKVREVKALVKVQDDRAKALDLALGAFSWLDGAIATLGVVNALATKLEALTASLAALQAAIRDLGQIGGLLVQKAIPAGAAEQLGRLELGAKDLDAQCLRQSSLNLSVGELNRVEGRLADAAIPAGAVGKAYGLAETASEVDRLGEKLDDLQFVVDRLDGMPAGRSLKVPLELAARLDGLTADWSKAAKEFNVILDAEEAVGKIVKDLASLTSTQMELEAAELKMLEGLDTCPSCGQALGTEAKVHLLKGVA